MRLVRLALPILVAAGEALAGATLEGTVRLPPAETAAAQPRYPVAASYAIAEPDPPAAVVFVEGEGTSAPAGPVELAQKGYQFSPGLLPVVTGTTVAFPNHDDEYHSVFSYSKTKRFDLGRYHRNETPAEITFDEAGAVRLYCEIHDHMRGTILVLDSPHFTKTSPDGSYRLEGVPPGRLVVKAWVDDGLVHEKTVEVAEGETLRLDFP